MKRLVLLVLLLTGFGIRAAELPYNPAADANAQIHQALAAAKAAHTPVLLIFGANWCEDCRALDHALKTEKNAALIRQQFQVVKVDVGNFDHNLDITQRYNDPTKNGIPAAVILSPEDHLLYSTRAGELSNARRMNEDGVYGFFRQALAKAQAAAP